MSQNSLLFGSLAAGVLGAIGIVATVAALGDGDDPADGDDPVTGDPGGVVVESNALHEARLDLAKRLGIDPEDVNLVSISHTGWDGCLGVITENGVCTEIFVAGTIALFETEDGSKTYRYHIAGNRFIATDFVAGTVDDGTPLDDQMRPDTAAILRDYIRGDLALKRDIDIDDIEVGQFDLVKWGDSCLGVAHPAILCAQGIVDGYVAYLTIEGGDDTRYRYHGSLAGPYVAVWDLDDGYTIVDPVEGEDPGQDTGGRIKEPRQAMREDLAGKLGVDVDDVEVEDFDEVTWPDGCVGVYRDGAVCTQALVDGWLAVLTVDGDDTEYRYHGTYDGGFIAVWELDPAGYRIGDPVGD